MILAVPRWPPRLESSVNLMPKLKSKRLWTAFAPRPRRATSCSVVWIRSKHERRFGASVGSRTSFFADGRMLAETIRVLACADAASRAHYPTTLFSGSEAATGRCTARSTIYAANIAAALMLHQWVRWLRDQPIDQDVTLNLLSSERIVAGR